MYRRCVCAVPTETRRGIGSSRGGVSVGDEPQCGFWEWNLLPLESSQCSEPQSHCSSACFYVCLLLKMNVIIHLFANTLIKTRVFHVTFSSDFTCAYGDIVK